MSRFSKIAADDLILSRPTKSAAKYGIYINVLLIPFVILWVFFANELGRGSVYLWALFFAIGHSIYANINARNLLFSFRYSLISILTIGTTVAWSTADLFIAPFGVQFQTNEATAALVGASLLAQIGTHIGWSLGRLSGGESLTPPRFYMPKFKVNIIISAALALSYAAVSIYIYREGGFVSASKFYGADRVDLGVQIGVLNQLVLFFVSLSFVMFFKFKRKNLVIIAIILLPNVLAVLSGNRADFLMQTAVLFLIVYMVNSGRCMDRLPYIKLVFLALFLFLLTGYLSVWRNIGSAEGALRVFMESPIFIKDRGGIPTVSLATGNQMLGGFYAVYAKLNYLEENYLFGSSYIDYLLMLPPAFLGLSRPEELAWKMEVNGELMQQGGVYEVTEAFWNFGFFGAFFIPLCITFFFSLLLNKCYKCHRYNMFFVVSFLTLGLNAPRGVWYQNFSYVRMISVLLVIYVLSIVINKIMQAVGYHHKGSYDG